MRCRIFRLFLSQEKFHLNFFFTFSEISEPSEKRLRLLFERKTLVGFFCLSAKIFVQIRTKKRPLLQITLTLKNVVLPQCMFLRTFRFRTIGDFVEVSFVERSFQDPLFERHQTRLLLFGRCQAEVLRQHRLSSESAFAVLNKKILDSVLFRQL